MNRISLFCVFLFVHMALSYPRINEDTLPTENLTDVSKEVDDALKVLRENFQNLVKVVKDNEMVKDLNERIQTFTSDVAMQGKLLAQKIQVAANFELNQE